MTAAIAFQGVNNVRDLGGMPVSGGRVVRAGLLYRGGTLFGATEQDCAKICDELGIRCVIDLRISYELAAKPDPDLAGVEYRHIPFYDNEIVGREYSKPMPGTIVIGRDFACDPDDFYRDLPNELTARQMAQALHVATDSAVAGRPVYFHCNNGKDRAGVFALVLLEILGASEQDILDDYLLTNVWRETQVERIYQRFLRLCQGDEDFARRITAGHCARPENLIAYRQSVDARYGSMRRFINDTLGFSDEDIAVLRRALTEPA